MAEYRTDYKRIDDITKCVGKTIEGVVIDESRTLLRFDDRTFFYGYESQSWNRMPGREDALRLGIIDQAEFDRSDAEEAARRRERDLRYDREQYERLRAKFEGEAKG